MPWLAIAVEADAADAQGLEEALFEAGALAVEIADAAAGTPFEQAFYSEACAGLPAYWLRSRVTALFPDDVALETLLPAALRRAGLPLATPYVVQALHDRDWVRASQQQYAPVRISERLWIVPSWHALPDPQAINVVLDPGVAFGTGTHPSTRLCLRWLDAAVKGGEGVIDFGCGSGILAITALKLGAGSARGIDIEPQALLAAERNAVQNQVESRFTASPLAGDPPAELVVANILANPLIVLAPLLARLTLPRGRIALSGILIEQAPEVRAAYAPWFALDDTDQEDGWALLSGVREER
jgi:ribosomal protein L11 methyltransferase